MLGKILLQKHWKHSKYMYAKCLNWLFYKVFACAHYCNTRKIYASTVMELPNQMTKSFASKLVSNSNNAQINFKKCQKLLRWKLETRIIFRKVISEKICLKKQIVQACDILNVVPNWFCHMTTSENVGIFFYNFRFQGTGCCRCRRWNIWKSVIVYLLSMNCFSTIESYWKRYQIFMT